MDTGFLIIAWIVSGVIGLVLGAIVDKLGAGFFLGLFLGPIGWIIVFLLPRDEQTKVGNAESTPIPSATSKLKSNRPERDLDSDAYKIWLGKQYSITKNDLFDKYECDEKLFATLDEALIYAHDLEVQNSALEKPAAIDYELVEAKIKEKEERRKLENQIWQDPVFLSFFVMAVIGIFWVVIP